MSRLTKLFAMALVLTMILVISVAGTAFAGNNPESPGMGPNPLAGDGIPDGSTLDAPNGPNGTG